MDTNAVRTTSAASTSVTARVGRTTDRQQRFGAIIGMRVLRVLSAQGELSAMELAKKLNIEESYVRRICRAAVEDGLIVVRSEEQRGTRPVQLYSWVNDTP
jgi:predicted ArsR family transcriptional regulator